jgi:hypothetical protein
MGGGFMRQRSLLVLSAMILAASPVLAQKRRAAEPPPDKIKYEQLKITAVAGQEIQVRRAYAMSLDCTLLEPNRIALITPPKGGDLVEKPLEGYPNFGRDNPRAACNSQKVITTYAIYKAREDFRGTDNFRFAIVYYDGTASHFDVEVTVWR